VSPIEIIAQVGDMPIDRLGDAAFRQSYGTRYAYYAGAMANGISSEEMVIQLGKAGFMASFGSGGLEPQRIESAIHKIKDALPEQPYAFNLLNNPNDPSLERKTAELYLQHDIRVIEASAYLSLTSSLVYYRAKGLRIGADGRIEINNHIIAKVSRPEVGRKFMEPAAEDILKELVMGGQINAQQAELARQVPMSDDITVEADSGGHTDNRPLVCLIPIMLQCRDEIQSKYHYPQPVRIGAAGGIGTPEAALAAFMMGAAYIVTGSINQACIESGASEHTRRLLAQAEVADVAMAPAGDMFEMGVKVQVLKRGTMFSMRAQKLYELYARCETWQQVPEKERQKLENTVFKRSFEEIWSDCVQFFSQRDPNQLERAQNNPRDQMALVFRWYLGLSSRWSAIGEKGREMDYQIWCGPAMGAFNDWTRNTYLADPQNRRVVDVAQQLLTGCAYLYRLRLLEAQGVRFPDRLKRYFAKEDPRIIHR
jgi:PfaD family protein